MLFTRMILLQKIGKLSMRTVFLISIFIFFSQKSWTQEGVPSPSGQKDFQLWLDAGLNYKVNKKLDLKFEAAYRRDNNLADINENYLELQVRTDPYKFLLLSGGYRFSGWNELFCIGNIIDCKCAYNVYSTSSIN